MSTSREYKCPLCETWLDDEVTHRHVEDRESAYIASLSHEDRMWYLDSGGNMCGKTEHTSHTLSCPGCKYSLSYKLECTRRDPGGSTFSSNPNPREVFAELLKRIDRQVPLEPGIVESIRLAARRCSIEFTCYIGSIALFILGFLVAVLLLFLDPRVILNLQGKLICLIGVSVLFLVIEAGLLFLALKEWQSLCKKTLRLRTYIRTLDTEDHSRRKGNDVHIAALKAGNWNRWRELNPTIKPNLAGLDWPRADLRSLDLAEANLCRAFLVGARLWRANLRGANLSGADLSSTELSDALLSGADLTDSILSKTAGYGADLTGARLNRADLTSARLSKANLMRADMTGANLWSARLDDANLTDANLSGANLMGTDLTRANLTGANLTKADMRGANLSKARLQGANLTDADLSRAMLTGTDLTGADLTRTKLDKPNR